MDVTPEALARQILNENRAAGGGYQPFESVLGAEEGCRSNIRITLALCAFLLEHENDRLYETNAATRYLDVDKSNPT